MQTAFSIKLIAVFLIFVMIFAGCASPTYVTDPDNYSRARAEGASYILVDRSENEPELPSLRESPSAYSPSPFTGALGRPMPGNIAGLERVSTSASSLPSGISREDEVRSVWISYLELGRILTGKTKSQFTGSISDILDNCAAYGLNTVIVQVRPFGDAIYPSDYFPWSYLCTGTEGTDPGFDPLEIMIAEARKRNLRFEAWLNPYRVRHASGTNAMSRDNQAAIWLNAGDGAVIRYNGIISYNPASKKARQLIVNGAAELVRNYDIDAIHIDDYFYPTTDAAFDSAFYNSYKNGGGTLSLGDWRRQNVEALLKELYAGIKAVDSDVLFGVSPQSSVKINYDEMYLDVEKIVREPGYCDYICPQIYFGFSNQAQPFAETVKLWNELVAGTDTKLYIGIAAYKVGAPDSWAGTGQNEWIGRDDLLKRMVEHSRTQGSYGGFVLYRYDSLFNPDPSVAAHAGRESANLRAIV